MSDGEIESYTAENTAPSASTRLTEVIADAYTFIRSTEANNALATVTLEQLIGDQILRNGESERSNATKYDPYTFDPAKKEAAGTAPSKPANFPGGSDTGRPTKLDRILAITNALKDTIAQIKALDPVAVVKPTEYTDVAEVLVPSED